MDTDIIGRLDPELAAPLQGFLSFMRGGMNLDRERGKNEGKIDLL